MGIEELGEEEVEAKFVTKICPSLNNCNLASDFGDKLPFTTTIHFLQVAISCIFFNKYY